MQSNLLTRFFLAILAICPVTTWASLPDLPPAPAAQAVAEMLMIDANQALAAERSKTPGFTSAPHTSGSTIHADTADPSSTPDQVSNPDKTTLKAAPQLTSIYGVGNRLHAQVVIDGQPTLYTTGRSQPLAGADTWQLKRIAPPCIDLQSSTHGAMRLCATRFGMPQ